MRRARPRLPLGPSTGQTPRAPGAIPRQPSTRSRADAAADKAPAASADMRACRRLSAMESSAGRIDRAQRSTASAAPASRRRWSTRRTEHLRRETATRQIRLGMDLRPAADAPARFGGSPSQTSTSAASTSRSARSTPIASTAILRVTQPGRVCQAHGHPPSESGTSIWSRVVPGTSVTIALSSPAIALIRLDFPAFGGPATTTVRHP